MVKAKTTLIPLILVCSGFGVMKDSRYNITVDDPTVWVKFSDNSLITPFKITTFKDDYGGIEGLPAEQMRIKVVEDIFADFHAIDTSYIRLSFYPEAGVVEASSSDEDSPFSAELAENRTINVKVGSTATAAGIARTEKDPDNAGYLKGCTIVLSAAVAENAEGYKSTLTHEIGHCLGLEHNHADDDAIMGYNSNQHMLGVDDQMGITYQYPIDPAYGKEAATLGLSCERQAD